MKPPETFGPIFDVAHTKNVSIVLLTTMTDEFREGFRNLILGYPTLIQKNFGIFFGEIHRVNPEILGYPRIPRIPH